MRHPVIPSQFFITFSSTMVFTWQKLSDAGSHMSSCHATFVLISFLNFPDGTPQLLITSSSHPFKNPESTKKFHEILFFLCRGLLQTTEKEVRGVNSASFGNESAIKYQILFSSKNNSAQNEGKELCVHWKQRNKSFWFIWTSFQNFLNISNILKNGLNEPKTLISLLPGIHNSLPSY